MSQHSAQSASLTLHSAPNSIARCSHSTIAGRQCRLGVINAQSRFCFRHQQLSLPRDNSPVPESVAQDLLANIDNFDDAHSINSFLGNVVKQLVYRRISRQDAIAYGYLSQLLLNSLRPLTVQRETEDSDALLQQITADAHAFSAIQEQRRQRGQSPSTSTSQSEPDPVAALHPQSGRSNQS